MILQTYQAILKIKKILKQIAPYIIPAFFLCMAISYVLSRVPVEYDPDEGLYLMRSFLQIHGFHLYKDIWTDTLPFLVLVVTGFFKIFGSSIVVARMVIAGFTCLLLWSFFKSVKYIGGTVAALVASTFLVSFDVFVRRGISVMGIIPALAMVVTSFYAVLLFDKTYKRRYLFLAGIFFACALLTRIYIILLLPGILIQLYKTIQAREDDLKKLWIKLYKSVVDFLFSFSITFGLFVFFAQVDFSQIFDIYAIAGNVYQSGGMFVASRLVMEFPIMLIFGASLYYSNPLQKRYNSIPIFGFIASMLAFYFHGPVWAYYVFLPYLFVCWMAGIEVGDLYNELLRNRNSIKKSINVKNIIIVAAIFIFIINIPSRIQDIRFQLDNNIAEYTPVVDAINTYKTTSSTIITDSPIVGFYTGLTMPPFLASASSKRSFTNLITSDDYLQSIASTSPDFVYLNRFLKTADLSSALNGKYTLIYTSRTNSRLFVAQYLIK